MTPELFIITGPNGAGKSTLGITLLPAHLQTQPIFDGDKYFLLKLAELFPRIRSPKYTQDAAFEATLAEFERLSEQALVDQAYLSVRRTLQQRRTLENT